MSVNKGGLPSGPRMAPLPYREARHEGLKYNPWADFKSFTGISNNSAACAYTPNDLRSEPSSMHLGIMTALW